MEAVYLNMNLDWSNCIEQTYGAALLLTDHYSAYFFYDLKSLTFPYLYNGNWMTAEEGQKSVVWFSQILKAAICQIVLPSEGPL